MMTEGYILQWMDNAQDRQYLCVTTAATELASLKRQGSVFTPGLPCVYQLPFDITVP